MLHCCAAHVLNHPCWKQFLDVHETQRGEDQFLKISGATMRLELPIVFLGGRYRTCSRNVSGRIQGPSVNQFPGIAMSLRVSSGAGLKNMSSKSETQSHAVTLSRFLHQSLSKRCLRAHEERCQVRKPASFLCSFCVLPSCGTRETHHRKPCPCLLGDPSTGMNELICGCLPHLLCTKICCLPFPQFLTEIHGRHCCNPLLDRFPSWPGLLRKFYKPVWNPSGNSPPLTSEL